MKTAKESYDNSMKDGGKLLDSLMDAVNNRIQEVSSKGLFTANLKGAELDNKVMRDQLEAKLCELGYHVVKVVTIKLINDVKIAEEGEFVIKWGAWEDVDNGVIESVEQVQPVFVTKPLASKKTFKPIPKVKKK
jgi:hypothetical protein